MKIGIWEDGKMKRWLNDEEVDGILADGKLNEEIQEGEMGETAADQEIVND